MTRSIITLIAVAFMGVAAVAQKPWHQELINAATGSRSAEVNAVVNREPGSGKVTNARYRIYIQPAVAEQVKSKLMGHQKEAQQYSLEPKKLMMSFDDNGVRTNYSLSLKGRKRLLLISQQKSDGTVYINDGNVVVVDGESSESRQLAAEARRQAAEVRRQAQLQAAEARRQAAEARRQAQLQAAEARRQAQQQAAEARRQAADERRRQADERRRQADERRRQADERRRQATVRRGGNSVTMISNKPTELQKQEIENIENSLRQERERRKRELQ